jgi:hypothetical protein
MAAQDQALGLLPGEPEPATSCRERITRSDIRSWAVVKRRVRPSSA